MSSPNVVTITDSNFDEEVLQSKVPVMLDFWAPWCGPCKMVSPIIDEIADAKAGSAKIGKVNVDENQNLAVRFRVNAIPLFLYFKDGEVRDQVGGVAPKASLVAKLDALAK